MKNYFFILVVLLSALFVTCEEKNGSTGQTAKTDSGEEIPRFTVSVENGISKIKKNGEDFFIKGIGGASRMDLAAACGANAFRTWDADEDITEKELEDARQNNMYMMMGIWLSHNKDDYSNENYKKQQRKKIRTLLDAFKNHPNMMIWCLGNEVNVEGADVKEAWEFINELAGIIKEQDPNHPVSTVISYSEDAINNIAEYAPNIDVIGFNAYGGIYKMNEMFENSKYKGAYLVSEWGPNGHWENGYTDWGAPIEPSSEEKRAEYEKRYIDFIAHNERCIGSFVFLWGQKQERTPTWYSLFVEKEVEGLPLNGEASPIVETMQKLWTGKDSAEKAPVVEYITINGKPINKTGKLSKGRKIRAYVHVPECNGADVTYVWEILKEATALGFGGSFEPRPERIGSVLTGKLSDEEIRLPEEKGNYRLYAYVLNDKGRVGTANIPFQIE